MKRFVALTCCLLFLLLPLSVKAESTDPVPPIVVNWLGVLPKIPQTLKDWEPSNAKQVYKPNDEVTFALRLLILPTGFESAKLEVWSDHLSFRQSKPLALQENDNKVKTTVLPSVTRSGSGFTVQLGRKQLENKTVYNIIFTARVTAESGGTIFARVSDGKPDSLDNADAIIHLKDQYLRVHKEPIAKPIPALEGPQISTYSLSAVDGAEIIRVVIGEDGEVLGLAKLSGKNVLPVHYNRARKRYLTSDGQEVISAKELQSLFRSLSISFLKPFSERALLDIAGYESQSEFIFQADSPTSENK